MLTMSTLVFDEILRTGQPPRFTSATFNELLGSPDLLTLHAVTSMLGEPDEVSLQCLVQHSGNGKDWVETESGINSVFDGDTSLFGGAGMIDKLGFARIAVSIGAGEEEIQCRIKLYAAGLTSAPRATLPAIRVPGKCGC
jgi:hypothetical protein